ncbi:MAG: formaldehyde-activating enzyme [Acidimicrobiales bacterium]|jgi:5,6,7,8-tetrahydromethanopterin hydro-lyase
MLIGESFIGDGINAAHINVVLGRRDGPVGTAWASALATPSAGHAPFVAVAQPGVPAVPPTLFVNKAAIAGPVHGNMTWGPAQAGVAQGVGRALEESVIDEGEVENLVLIVAVWVNPNADDEVEVFRNNQVATLEALRKAKEGLPRAAEFISAARSPFNPFFRPA